MGFISPTDTNDTYPVIDPLYGVDGFRNVNTLSNLDLIPEPRRRAGMVVGVSGGTNYYKLNSSPWNYNFADWSVFNTGGGSVSGNYLPLSGGTVTGNTVFTLGLSANTISATTYQNLPTDIRVTGGTYLNGTSTFTNNTGGTFSVIGFYTGETDNNQYVTGFTYSSNTFTILDNSGNTFSSTFNVVTGLTVNGVLSATTISGGTFYGNGLPITKINNVITVGLSGLNTDFSSIKSAVDYIIGLGDSSITNRYVISVGPGVFYENEIDLTQTPYVSIVGSSIQTTQILPITNNQHIIKIGINNEISFLNLSGTSSGYAGIYCYDVGDYAQVHKISMNDCDIGILVESSTQDTKFYGEYVDLNGNYTYGIKVVGNNGYLALANMENYYNFPTGAGITYCNYATGSGATISVFVGDNQSNGVSGSTAFYAQDGAGLYCSTITIDGFTYGIRNPNIGDPIRFDIDNASVVGCEWDLYVERSTTFGTFGGSSSHQKVFTNSPDVYWLFLDIDDGELELTRKASVTFADGTHTDLTTLVFQGSTMGLISGGSITTISGFTVSTATGFGYLSKTLSPEIIMRIDWVDSQIVLGANENKYLYINENSVLSASGSKPSSVNNILLGRAVTNSTGVSFIDLSPVHSDHTSNRFGNLFRNALGPIYSNGSIVTENATPFRLNITTGEYYYSSNMFIPSGGTSINFTQYYRDGSGGWITSATTVVNNTSYDGNGSLSALTTNYYTKHTLYVVGENGYENYFLVLGQNEYSTLVQAEDALLPTPPTFFTDSVVQVANIYIEQGASGITQVEDIRPVIGFKAGGVNASSVHGNLLGLAADDHTQYLLVDGGRSMGGNLDMGGNEISNVGNVDGVDVSSHATRHQFGGSDPVGSTTPSPNAIPYADVSGTLDGWVSTATTTTLGKVKLSTTPVSASNPIVIGDNDIRVARSLTGGTYSNNTFTYTNNTGGTFNVLFNTVTGLTVSGNTIISSGLTATTISASTISGGTLYGNGSNLTGLNIYKLTGGTEGQIISKDSSSDYDYTWKYDNEVIQLQIISEGNTISNGFKGYRYIDKDLTLHKITMLSNSAATVDFRVAYSGGTIGTTGLSGQSYNVDTTLSGWVTNLSGGTFIEFYVDTAGTINTTQGVVILTIDCYKKI